MGNKIYLFILLIFALIFLAIGCKKDRVAVKPLLIARVVNDTIFRDQETQNAINQTSSVQLHRNSINDFQLIVTKSRYRLDVYQYEELVKTYPVSLGINPEGSKEVQGDWRTPEGIYTMIPYHPSPSFGSCFYINYTNEKDAERGLHKNLINSKEYQLILEKLKNGERSPYNTELGGLILLHGTRVRNIKSLTDLNWTIGCIAMENEDLLELLKVYHTSDRPLLTIKP